MKKMRRFLAVLMTMVMVMGFAVTAMADGTYTLTLNDAQEGHTYTAYQIFTGDLSGDTLSNIVWGSGVTEAGQTQLGDAATKAESLKTVADAEAFAVAVAPYLETEASSVTIADGTTSGTISGLSAGYYLVKTTETTNENGVYTYYIMKIVKDTSAKIKADVPEIDKTVNDNDANIGDTVTFTLTATMPSTFEGYETYKVVFHDTMFKGLTYNNDAKASVEGFEVSTGKTESGDTTITVSCDDVLKMGVKAGDTITVTYTATLNQDAVIGNVGNLNEVYLEYSNDPNWNGVGEEPTGDTPKDEEKVYTWEIPVFKYTKDGEEEKALAGAGFELYDGENLVKFTKEENSNIYKVDPNGEVVEIITDNTGRFEIEGLEQGKYVLKEKTTPAGYNTVGDITVTIGEDGKLTIDQNEVTEVKVLNQAGTVLPETGGIGTTIFYVAGAILVIGAAVVMITRKRMDA